MYPAWLRWVVIAVLVVFGAGIAFATYFYVKLGRRVDARLAAGPFSGTVSILSGPRYAWGPDETVVERPPELITSMDGDKERRLVHYRDIPANLVHAVISAEDKHFFYHDGFDLLRMAKAAWVDVREGRKEQGASTLSMQLARGLWLDPDKSWKRKTKELLITLHLEEKLSKQQIFEDYANLVYLGRRGPFSIQGFGEAAHAYFGKDISQVDNSEAALLAGLVQRPSYFNPYRYPDRARERRNVVLALMRDNHYLTAAQYAAALAEPVHVIEAQAGSMQDQYFVDFVNHELEGSLEYAGKQTRTVETTLDPDLQKAAEEAVRIGMAKVDAILRKRKGAPIPPGEPQVALVALDPHTGEIKALVGGRNYAASQLNRALAERQPGSVFKPVVYAAALATAVNGGNQVFTPATILQDAPTTFSFNGQSYQPKNFEDEFMGAVTLRSALVHSLNVASVSLAQQVGYKKVASLAAQLGLDGVEPTPAMALGSYDATPVEIAGAYTAFANHGVRVSPTAIAVARAADGAVLYRHEPDGVPVLDPRVAYLMVNIMQDVLRNGTGAAARATGFTLPAAGKTGTSRDGWFAGFTTRLECIVWVGFDDGRNLNLEGARSALPIWTEFMKGAAHLPNYAGAAAFTAPSGIVSAKICPECGQLAGADCPDPHEEVFISGTQPGAACALKPPVDADGDKDQYRSATGLRVTNQAPATANQDATSSSTANPVPPAGPNR